MEILDKILLTEIVVFLISLCSPAIGIDTVIVISKIIVLISLISIVVTSLIAIWRM